MGVYEFRMPALGADMEAGTLVEWQVKPGQEVKRGQVVAVVETQKGAIEVEIWESGTVDSIVVGPGQKVPVGAVLATLTTAGEAPPPAAAAAPVAIPTAAAPPQPAPAAPRARISPAARKLAEELGIDIACVEPGSPGGVVSREDVECAARAANAARAAKAAAPEWHAQMRRAIAAAMARSKREIPHYYLGTEIDMTRTLTWLEQENAKRPVAERMLYAVLLVKAVALALREVPELNGFFTDGEFRPGPGIHIGMAIAMRGGGLVAPAIRDVDRKSLGELMADLRDLVTRVRGGRLRSSELTDPTITLTNLGEQGVETVYGVIYPPQVALVGIGKITERLRAGAEGVSSRRMLTATLAADHRASDGHRGALFLAAVGRLLQEPEKL